MSETVMRAVLLQDWPVFVAVHVAVTERAPAVENLVENAPPVPVAGVSPPDHAMFPGAGVPVAAKFPGALRQTNWSSPATIVTLQALLPS